MELSEIREQSAKAAEQVCEAAKLKIGDLFVVGCSSSEILGEKIGTHSSVEVAEAVFEGIHSVLHEHGVELAAQSSSVWRRSTSFRSPRQAVRSARLRTSALMIRWRLSRSSRAPLRAWTSAER